MTMVRRRSALRIPNNLSSFFQGKKKLHKLEIAGKRKTQKTNVFSEKIENNRNAQRHEWASFTEFWEKSLKAPQRL